MRTARALPFDVDADAGAGGGGVHRRRRRRRSRGSGLRRFWSRLWFGLHDIDAALEICAVLDDDAGGANIAGELRVLANFDFIGGFHVSVDRTQHHHFARLDGRLHNTIRADGEFMLHRLHSAFKLAIDIEIFAAIDVTGDLDGLSDGGCASTIFRLESGRRHTGHGCLLPYFDGCWRRRCGGLWRWRSWSGLL